MYVFIFSKTYRHGASKEAKPKASLLLQTIHAINAALGGKLTHTADALLGGAAATGAGSEVHLAFGVLVH